VINWFHVLFNGPLLIYVSLNKPENIKFYYLLFMMGLVILYVGMNKIMKKRGYRWLYAHMLLFSPLLLRMGYLGINGKDIPNYMYSFLRAVGVGAIGHHMITIIKRSS